MAAMKNNHWLILFILLLPCTASFAEIYKHIDEYGNVTYSDEAPATNAKQHKLKPLNTRPAIAAPKATPKPTEAAPTPAQTTQTEENTEASPAPQKPLTLKFASPIHNYRAGPAVKTLTVILIPNQKLADDQFIQLLIDGIPYGEPSKSNNFNVPLPRSLQGQRFLSANIVDSAGTILATAKPRTLFVIRPKKREAPN